MKRILTLLTVLLSISSLAQNLTVRHLSSNHSMVRVDSPDRYILLPVQESAPEATISILTDLSLERKISVRLASDKADYMVPLDISAFKGKNLILDVVTRRGPSAADIRDLACWEEIRTSSAFDTANKEYFRPEYHFTPAYGWMNDPNGMVYKDGEWHLFYQYNPYGSIWGNMTWGHAVSRDLVNWEHLDPAIFSDNLGAVFSGSAVVDEDNVSGFGKGAIVAMYTSAGDSQTQSLAWSNDGGRTFTKYKGNPVIVSDKPDFRDPNMFYDENTEQWKVILAAGQEVQFWASDNLRDWKYESSFGEGYGSHDGVWECPDLVKTGDKYVLLLNINPGGPFGGSATQYFVGEYDGHSFKCEDAPSVTKWMDYGKDHYATVTWSNAPDGRKVALAWMSNWQYGNAVPTRQFRSANSVPRDLSLIERGGTHILKSVPSPEVDALRGTPVKSSLSKGKVNIPFGSAYELVLEFKAPKKGSVGFTLSNPSGEKVVMEYDVLKGIFSMDRNASGEVSFSSDFPCETVAPTLVEGRLTLRLLVDKCSIEAFGNDFCMTNLVFPTVPYSTLAVESGSKVNVTVYPLAK